jgi:hypothetical protein
MKARALPACLCLAEVSFICSLHRENPQAFAIEEGDALSDECPWNPDELPDRLKGFGYRGADQDGYNGSEWVTPAEDHAEQMIEGAKVLLDAVEV